jgi:hypothetical protein
MVSRFQPNEVLTMRLARDDIGLRMHYGTWRGQKRIKKIEI